jgi:hypothetical protein
MGLLNFNVEDVKLEDDEVDEVLMESMNLKNGKLGKI